MAGSIQFVLAGNALGMETAVQRAQTAMQRLRISTDEINAAFARANASSGGGGGGGGLTAGDLKSKGRALSGALNGVAMNASMFLGPEVQQVIYPAMFLGKELKGLSAAMKLAGISVGTAVGAMGLFVIAAGAVSVAFQEWKKMKEAEKTELATTADLGSQQEARRKKLFGLLDLAQGGGTISKTEADQWRAAWAMASSDSAKNDQLKGLGQRLNAVGGYGENASRQDALEAYEKSLRMAQASAQGGVQKAMEEIYQRTSDDLKKAFEVASAAGKNWEPIRKALIEARDRQLAELNPIKDIPEETAAARYKGGRVGMSALEKMGLVLTSGIGGGDPAASTARNTEQILREARMTNKILSRGGNANFANQ